MAKVVSVQEGAVAPDFTAATDGGDSLRLSDLKGKPVILYFYPRADTPGCTKEACNFRDEFQSFRKRGAVILGVSPDSIARQAKFREKYGLPFTLLADEDHRIAELYGVWKEKTMYGKKRMGIERTTFLIDRQGVIRKIFPKVKVEEHVAEVLATLEAIS